MPDPNKLSVSATQVPALFGISPYDTEFTLYHWFKDDQQEDAGDARMEWGTKMQPLLLDKCREDLALEVYPNDFDIYHRDGAIGCTRDADILCPDRGWGALETKCVFDYGVWMNRWQGGTPPKDIELQLQTQMLVGMPEHQDGPLQFQWGVIAVWVCGEMHYFEREPSPSLWKAIQDKASAFIEDVAAGVEPEPFGDPVETQLINQLFPSVEKEEWHNIDDEDLEESARLYQWATGQKGYFTKLEKQLKAKLLAASKDKGKISFSNGTEMFVSKSEQAGGTYERKPSVRTSIKIRGGDSD